MTELSDLSTGEVVRINRALASQLSPLVGPRSSGYARVKTTSGTVQLPPNIYAAPVINGSVDDSMFVKVAFNPATTLPHQQGGAWPIDTVGMDVRFVASIGGQWTVPAGSKLRFTPDIPGLEPAVVLAPGITGGSRNGPVSKIVVFDDFDNPQAMEVLRSGLASADGPGIVVSWLRSYPVEGAQGFSSGASRRSRGIRVYFEEWIVLLISTNANSNQRRRDELIDISEYVRSLLGERRRNDDGERLVSVKPVEVQGVAPVRSDTPNSFALRISVRTTSARRRIVAGRDFAPWLRTRYVDILPEGDNDGPLTIFDIVDPMPQDPP